MILCSDGLQYFNLKIWLAVLKNTRLQHILLLNHHQMMHMIGLKARFWLGLDISDLVPITIKWFYPFDSRSFHSSSSLIQKRIFISCSVCCVSVSSFLSNFSKINTEISHVVQVKCDPPNQWVSELSMFVEGGKPCPNTIQKIYYLKTRLKKAKIPQIQISMN